MNNKEKIFLIVNLSFFGDILLTNALCQNIKKYFPNSKIVFLVDKKFEEAAKYQKDVDFVISIDKRRKHRSLLGLFRFVFNSPYKNKIDTAFVIYGNDRGIILSKLLGAKNIVSGPNWYIQFLINKKQYDDENYTHMQDLNGNFISQLTGKNGEILPIKYEPVDDGSDILKEIKLICENNDVVCLCTTSKNKAKDMPVETAVELVKILNKNGKKVLFVGAGEVALDYSRKMKELGCVDYIDFVNKTSINQLGYLLKNSKSLISVDTGTLHLGCAVGVPSVAIFYLTDMISKWAPIKSLYNCEIVDRDYSADFIFNTLKQLN